MNTLQSPFQGLRFHAHTLGCRLNQYESESLESRFLQAGCTTAGSPEEADICLVNTCTITNKADRKTRNTISRLRRDLGSHGLLVVTGCFVENHPDWLGQDEHLLVVDNQHKNLVFDLVEAWLRGEIQVRENDGRKLASFPVSGSRFVSGTSGRTDSGEGSIPVPAPGAHSLRPAATPFPLDSPVVGPGDVFDFPESGETRRVRAFLKIQDGCDQFCTYCIVPHVRGRAQSRPAAEILANARTLLDSGYRELVLTGVNISRYRDGESGLSFTALLRSLLELEGPWGLRIASMEPELIDPEFLDLMAHPRLKPHLHLCLQSGSDRILKAMGRTYSTAWFLQTIQDLREKNPDFAVSTDLICGFPGETREDFRQSLDFVRLAGFSRVHVFPFSPRAGTQAATLPGQLERRIILTRAKEAQDQSRQEEESWLRRFVGRDMEMLCEKARIQDQTLLLEGHTPQFDTLQICRPLSPQEIATFRQEDWRKKTFTARTTRIGYGDDNLILVADAEPQDCLLSTNNDGHFRKPGV